MSPAELKPTHCAICPKRLPDRGGRILTEKGSVICRQCNEHISRGQLPPSAHPSIGLEEV